MKIDFVSIKESEPSSSSESDFKDVLKSVKGNKKSVKAVKQISASTKYERRKKKERTLKNFVISPIFDLFFSGDKRTRDEIKINHSGRDKAKVLPIEELDESSLTSEMLQKSTNSIDYASHFESNDELCCVENKKTERNEYGMTNFFVQRANQEKLMLHPNYINTKTSRDYQVYFKGRRYHFNINENDVLSRVEDKDDGS